MSIARNDALQRIKDLEKHLYALTNETDKIHDMLIEQNLRFKRMLTKVHELHDILDEEPNTSSTNFIWEHVGD